jgi:hypothetical protein
MGEDGPMAIHMLPYHRTLGDKRMSLAFFIIPTNDIEFMFGHGSIKKNLYKDFVQLSSASWICSRHPICSN